MYIAFAFMRIWIFGRLTRNIDTVRCVEWSALHFRVLVPWTHATKYASTSTLAFFNCYNVKIFAEVWRASYIVTGMRRPRQSAKENTQFPTFLALSVCLYGAQHVLSPLISLLPKKSPAFSLCQIFIIVEILMLSILCVFKLFFISFKQRAAIVK